MHQKYKKTYTRDESGGRPDSSKHTNGVGWRSRHCEQAVVANEANRAIPTRASHNFKTPFSSLHGIGRPLGVLSNRLFHSIPSKKSLSNKQLRCFSLCIPLVCMLVLFGLFCVASSIGSEFSNEVYAVEGDGNNDDGEGKLSVTISGDLEQTTPAVAGETAYRSHNVQINGSNIDNYTMQISYGSGSSMLENTPILDGTEPTVISGADGRNASSTDDNWWGYSWHENSEEDNTLTFQTMPQYGSGIQLEGGKPSDGTVSVNKTLTFAAKFGSDAAAGHYKAGVLLSLAASPKKVTASGFGGITTMQEMTPQVCASVEPGTVGELEDVRDHKIYTVARIKNRAGDTTDAGANCWMTQNLALDLEQYWNKETMVMSLSDVPSDSYWTQRSIGAATKKNQGFTISSSNYNAIEYTNTTTTGSAENQLKINSGTYDPSYGYYYTWCAATVGCKNSGGGNPGAGVDAVASICPKGWQLPSGNTNGQWYNLLNGMNMTSVAAEPYKIPAAGSMYSDGFNNGGTRGNYWSRTANDTNYAYVLRFSSSSFAPGTNGNGRYLGYSVRCVAKPATMDTITYMQQMTPEVCSTAELNKQYTLTDKRDGKPYTVAKINNKVGGGANCWMTQNLALDLEQYWNKETMVMSLSDVPSDSYWTQRSIGAATKKNQGFTISSSNYNAIEYTNTTTTGSAENQLKINSGTYDPSYGYYYTWCAATVGCKDSSGNIPSSGDVVASICPKGWQLPSGNTNGQWYNLTNGLNMTTAAADPYKIPAAGYMNSGGFYDGGAGGYYWSRTANDTNSAYRLNFYSSSFNPGTNYDNRYLGFSVRCVAKSS